MSDPSKRSEEQLRRFREGDPDAFRELVEPHVDALRARVRRRLGGVLRKKVSVSDVVQEAQIVAFERRNEFAPQGTNGLRNWLLAIADRRALKAVERHVTAAQRDAARELTRDMRPATAELPGAGPSPSHNARAAEATLLTREAMQVLSADDRRLLQLVYVDQLGLRAAATELGVSHEATKKRHARALVRLGRALERLRDETRRP